MQSVDKILDVIDPIQPLTDNSIYSPQDFQEEGLVAKVPPLSSLSLFGPDSNLPFNSQIKVIVSTVDPVEINSVLKVFEKIYGEEHVYAKGAPVESGLAKQALGMKSGLRAAQSKINNLMALDSFKDKTDFIFIGMENFIEEVDGEWWVFLLPFLKIPLPLA